MPTCFKQTTIVPVPKNVKVTFLNDYCPITLTSVAMKCFERLVMAHIHTIIRNPRLTPICIMPQQISLINDKDETAYREEDQRPGCVMQGHQYKGDDRGLQEKKGRARPHSHRWGLA
jgi:hypothetical protein